jgi:hypothetical protein
MGAVAALILIAGVWASWGTAQHVMLTKGREQGTVEVTRCGGGSCSGPYAPVSAGSRARESVVIEDSVAVSKGRTYTVVVKPGSDDVVRSGPAGVLYAWVPLGGALLLASVVVAGGLRRTRAAWADGGVPRGVTRIRRCPRARGERGGTVVCGWRGVSRCCGGRRRRR